MSDDKLNGICSTFEIPAIPSLLQEILDVAANPRCSYTMLEEHISRDAGVVMQLLKTVNSAHYGPRGTVDSIGRALVVLGVSVVTGMVSGLMLLNAFQRLPDHDRTYLRSIWRHALASSRIVKVLSERQPPVFRDSAFVAALLQNVGHLVLSRHFGAQYRTLRDRDLFPGVADERRLLGVDHAAAGAYMLQSWHFPPAVVDAVANHHNPGAADAKDVALLIAADELIRAIERQPQLLDDDADAADATLLDSLAMVGWDWDSVTNARERILEGLDLARHSVANGN